MHSRNVVTLSNTFLTISSRPQTLWGVLAQAGANLNLGHHLIPKG